MSTSGGSKGGAGNPPVVAPFINTFETSSSTTFVDLATVGPTVNVTIPSSGNVVVWVGCNAQNNTANDNCHMAVAVTGTDNVPASDNVGAFIVVPTVANQSLGVFGNMIVVTGLTPGAVDTFTAKYRVNAGTGQWGQRAMIVFPA